MSGYAFTFAGADLVALPSGGLHWPAARLLVVADLHLGKALRLARRGGGLLPPYETRATLMKLDADLARTDPATVLCLGDSFDDLEAGAELDPQDRDWLARQMAGRVWIWAEGNHDPGPGAVGGTHLAEWQHGGLRFRHIATADGAAEVSGHYHPKARLAGQRRPCFLIDGDRRLILPAYGTYTGGLACGDPALGALMGPGALAVVTGARCLALPYSAA